MPRVASLAAEKRLLWEYGQRRRASLLTRRDFRETAGASALSKQSGLND